MRSFLLFIALAMPVAMASPYFWWIVATQTGASAGIAIEADGTPTQVVMGPKAHWPDWAPAPDGVRLKAATWFKPTPPQPEGGFGDLSFSGKGRELANAYADQLRAAGWTVETALFRSTYPSLPPRPFTSCHLTARRAADDPRALLANFDVEPYPGTGRLHWSAGPAAPNWQAAKGEPC